MSSMFKRCIHWNDATTNTKRCLNRASDVEDDGSSSVGRTERKEK